MTRDEARVVLSEVVVKVWEQEEFHSAGLFLMPGRPDAYNDQRFEEAMRELAPLFEKGVEACRTIVAEEGDLGEAREELPDLPTRSE
jgi:hypothetical protein